MINVFNYTLNNVGDFYSPPFRYFDLGNRFEDIKSSNFKKLKNELLIIGGGALTGIVRNLHLENVLKENTSIAWGVGSDARATQNEVLDFIEGEDHFSNTWNNCDLISTRVFYANYDYVPCASCMHKSFDIFKKVKPTRKIGVYSHWKRPMNITGIEDQLTNSGINIDEKLNFISKFEIIITNAYHGLYWATLLGKKVICIPNKSGLFTLRYKPVYLTKNDVINNELISRANSYNHALDECRSKNIEFYKLIQKKYF